MGRNAGGVNQYGGSGGYAKDVKRYINDTLKRKYDLKDKDTKLLRKFIKDAKSYNPKDVSNVIKSFDERAMQKKVSGLSFEHSIFVAQRSELYAVAHRAWCNKNLTAIKVELKKRNATKK